MRDESARHAVGYQDYIGSRASYGFFQYRAPLVAIRMVPVTLLYTRKRRVRSFPQSLPMLRAGVSHTREYESGCLYRFSFVAHKASLLYCRVIIWALNQGWQLGEERSAVSDQQLPCTISHVLTSRLFRAVSASR